MKKIIFFLSLMLSLFATQGELSHIITPRGGSDPLSENKEIVKQFYKTFSQNDPRVLRLKEERLFPSMRCGMNSQ